MRRFLPSGLFIVTMAVLIFLYAPIGVVVANSFNDDANLTSWGGFTLRWYETAVENQRVRDAAVTSLKVAAITTVFSLVIAVTAGLWSRTASQRKRRALDASTYMRIVLPEVVAALALFILFRRLELDLGLLGDRRRARRFQLRIRNDCHPGAAQYAADCLRGGGSRPRCPAASRLSARNAPAPRTGDRRRGAPRVHVLAR